MFEGIRAKTCCLSGHREIPSDELADVMRRVELAVRELVERGVVYYGVGGAIGFDTECAKLLLRLRDTDFPHMRVILVYPFDGYMSRWSRGQREEAMGLLERYDKVVRVAERGSRGVYLQRNRKLVDGSSCCICYCTRRTGGTAYTVEYAESRGLEVYNVALPVAERLITIPFEKWWR